MELKQSHEEKLQVAFDFCFWSLRKYDLWAVAMECLFDFQKKGFSCSRGTFATSVFVLKKRYPRALAQRRQEQQEAAVWPEVYSSKELPGYAKDVEHCCSFLHPDLSCSPDAVKSSKGKTCTHTHTQSTQGHSSNSTELILSMLGLRMSSYVWNRGMWALVILGWLTHGYVI